MLGSKLGQIGEGPDFCLALPYRLAAVVQSEADTRRHVNTWQRLHVFTLSRADDHSQSR